MNTWKMDLHEKVEETKILQNVDSFVFCQVGDIVGITGHWQLPESRKGGVHSHCSGCVNSSCPLTDVFDPMLWKESCLIVKCKCVKFIIYLDYLPPNYT